MKKRSLLLPIFCSLFLLFGLTPSIARPSKEITVSGAISLKDAFERIGKVFEERHPGAKVRFNFAASGDLARQIEAGAPVDVFASAARKEMDDIDKKGLITAGSRVNFAANSVVLVKPVLTDIRIESFEDLKKTEVKKIVIGNPKTVPAGRYAEEILRHLGLWDGVKDKLVFAEHVRQALDYVARNEVDAALVYSTDARAREKEVRIVMKAPDGSHRPAVYPIAVVRGAADEFLARDFISLILSADGQRILKNDGFETVK